MIKLNANTLTVGEKYSVILPNGLVPTNYQGTLVSYYFSSFAQHDNALYLFLKVKGTRSNKMYRVVLSKPDTAIIVKGWDFKSIFRKEVIEDNPKVTVSKLHRLTINDFKPEQVVLYKEYGQEFETNKNFDGFEDYTTSYCCKNNVSPREATESEGYINYIKNLLQEKCYNVEYLFKQIKINQYSILENCLKLATEYNW